MSTKDNFSKIRVTFPDGSVNCDKNVTATYRKTIDYLGRHRVREVGLTRNGINIVATPEEAITNKAKAEQGGKKKPKVEPTCNIEDVKEGLIICTQFETNQKLRILETLNDSLSAGLKIHQVFGEAFISRNSTVVEMDAEAEEGELTEGLLQEYLVRRFERNNIARQLCIEHYGSPVVCQICGFDFAKTYGSRENGEAYIEVHHINPVASRATEGIYRIDYARDLLPVCSNCHSMLHHLVPGKLLTPDDLRARLRH